jgi:hypothetical protein
MNADERGSDVRGTRMKRTGFPSACPIDGAVATMAHCDGCGFHVRSAQGWSCEHPDYQDAPGVHFCTCGSELGPWAEAHGWAYCGGPTSRCRRA